MLYKCFVFAAIYKITIFCLFFPDPSGVYFHRQGPAGAVHDGRHHQLEGFRGGVPAGQSKRGTAGGVHSQPHPETAPQRPAARAQAKVEEKDHAPRELKRTVHGLEHLTQQRTKVRRTNVNGPRAVLNTRNVMALIHLRYCCSILTQHRPTSKQGIKVDECSIYCPPNLP